MSIWLLIFFLTILISIFYVVWGSGILHKIELKTVVFPETRVAYVTYIGDYSNAYKESPKIEKIIKEKFNFDLSKQPCFGLYYDDPRMVPPEKRRAVVGKFLPDSFKETEAPDGIIFGSIPRVEKSIQVIYPMKSILGLFVGMYRVYPAFRKYINDNNLNSQQLPAMLEVYGYEGSNVLFSTGVGKAEGVWAGFPKDKNE